MLHKNKIFLKLLGSFYDQTANTEFSGKIDYIYTSILFNRYVEILHKSILSVDNSYPDVPHFGYIRPSEIDIGTSTIIVKDTNGNAVDGVNFLSFGYLDIEEFFKVENGVVGQEVIDAASESMLSVIPVVYITSSTGHLFSSGSFSFTENMNAQDTTFLSSVTMKLISDQIAYFPDTLNTLDKLVNVVLGAEYAKADETVLHVDDNIIITDYNSYDLLEANIGRQIVSVGDMVKASSLITRIATVTSDVARIGDVASLDRFMTTTGLSTSNYNYLKKISSAVSKRKIAADIPATAFALLDTEALSLVSSAIGMSSSRDLFTTSSSSDSDTVEAISSAGYLIADESTMDVAISGFWILELPADSMNVGILADESFMSTSSDNVEPIDDYALLMDPVVVNESISVSEDLVNAFTSDATVIIQDSDVMEGFYKDTYIATASEEVSEMFVESTVGNADDIDQFIDNGTVTLATNFPMVEDDYSEISVSDAATTIISDIMEHVAENFDIISMQDSLLGETEIIEIAGATMIGMDSLLSADPASIVPLETGDLETSVTIPVEDIASTFETIEVSGIISEQVDATYTTNDDVTGNLVAIKDALTVLDTTDVTSDNVIDT